MAHRYQTRHLSLIIPQAPQSARRAVCSVRRAARGGGAHQLACRRLGARDSVAWILKRAAGRAARRRVRR
jgi:hypothetical protein